MFENKLLHRHIFAVLSVLALAACSAPANLQPLDANNTQSDFSSRPVPGINQQSVADSSRKIYAQTTDNGHVVAAIEDDYLSPGAIRKNIRYSAPYPPGTIIVDPGARRLYHLLPGNRAIRYLAGVGAAGYEFSGEAVVARKADWPRWTPTPDMLQRDPHTYGPVKAGLPGGPDNPLSARALYLYQGGKDTLYRIHGTPFPWTVGYPTSGGCIRLFNQDVIHLAARVSVGTRVIVLPPDAAGKWTRPGAG